MSIPISGEAEGRRFTMELLTADQLTVDQDVQRKLNESRVAKIAADFHERALGVFVISARQGLDPATNETFTRHVVLDGQTRLAALRKFSGTPDTKLEVVAQVYHGLSRAEEAEIFLEHNDRAAVRKIDLFRLALVVQRHGFEAKDSAVPERRFTAISTAQRIVKMDGGTEALDRAFELIQRSWGYRVNAASAEAVDGLGVLFHRHGTAVDVVGFARKLAATDTPQTFKSNVMAYRAAVGISRTEAAYRYVLKVYNSGRRTKGLEPRS
jgi:hypothetical protein